MENKIFYIMGKSGSGKDTIYNYIVDTLCKDCIAGMEGIDPLCPIIMNTTRPMRDGEINGLTYNFVNDADLAVDIIYDNVLELRTYETINIESVKCKWHYYTSKKSIDLENHSYIGIGTPSSFFKLLKTYPSSMYPIMLSVGNDERFFRLVEREKKFKNPNYLELCRRFISDEDDFSKGIEYLTQSPLYRYKSFENKDRDTCCHDVYNYIISIMKK